MEGGEGPGRSRPLPGQRRDCATRPTEESAGGGNGLNLRPRPAHDGRGRSRALHRRVAGAAASGRCAFPRRSSRRGLTRRGSTTCRLHRITRDQRHVHQGFEDAIKQGVTRASKTLRNVRSAWVKEQQVRVGERRHHRVSGELNGTFVLERRRHGVRSGGADRRGPGTSTMFVPGPRALPQTVAARLAQPPPRLRDVATIGAAGSRSPRAACRRPPSCVCDR